MNILTQRILIEANKWVGITEAARNDGPEIRAWLARVGIDRPAAWCVAFAWCMWEDACQALGVVNRLPPTASTHRLFKHAKNLGLWTATPGPGYIFGIDHGGGLGHGGLVVEEQEDTRLLTIEGNTNRKGSREGNALMLKSTRKIADMTLGFIDPGLMLRRAA